MTDSLKKVLASVPENALNPNATPAAPSVEEVLTYQQNAPTPVEMELQGIRDRYRSEVDDTVVNPELVERLRDPDFVEALAVSRREGNDLTNEGFGRDLFEMDYAGLYDRYGRDVANEAWRVQQGRASDYDARTGERTTGQKIGDTALDFISGFTSMSGNTFGQAFSAGISALDPNRTVREGAVATAQTTQDLSDWITSFQSDERQAFDRIMNIESGLDSNDNDDRFQQDIENGDSVFAASLKNIGRDILSTTERLIDNPSTIAPLVAESLGSLGPSAKIASGGSRLLSGATARAGGSQTAQRTAGTLGAVSGIGLSEASGAYSQTVNEVMAMPFDSLAENSDTYRQLVADGMSPEDARTQVAGMAGERTFVRQLPTAALIGLVSSKFETGPMRSFQGVPVTQNLRTMASQALEESLQGGTGTFNTNVGVRDFADENRNLSQGVGSDMVTGAIAGAGMAGVTGAPSTTVNALRGLLGETQYNDPLRQDIVGASPARRAVQTAGEALSPIVDAAAPVVNAARERTSALAGRVSEGVQEYAARPSSKEVTQSVEAAVNITEGLREAVATGQLEDTVAQIVSQPDTDVPSASFTDVAGGNRSLMDNITGITAKLGSKKFRPSTADTAYAAAQYQKLRSVVGALPKDLQTEAGRILSSKLVQELSAKAEKLDLNRNPEDADPITTLNVAKTNPANVNPDVADKILEESGENLTPEEARYVRVASKIGRIVNRNVEKQVEIRTNENINLTQASRPKKQDLTVEGVSRQIHAEGKTDANLRAKYRSINDFARDILSAVQSGEQTGAYPPDATVINQKGQVVPVRQVIQEMANFAQHMKNKVQALNESIADGYTTQGGLRGGKLKDFDGLVNGKFQNSSLSSNGLRGVRYSPDNANSVAFAQQVAQDQNDLIEVYNTLLQEFPETFEGFEAIEPVVLTPATVSGETTQNDTDSSVETDEQPTGVEESSDAPAEEATSTSEDLQNPTADEEVSSSEDGVDETGAQATDETTTGEEVGTDELADATQEDRDLFNLLSDSKNWDPIERVRVKAITNQGRTQTRDLIEKNFGPKLLKRVRQVTIYPKSVDDGWGYAWTPEGQRTGQIFLSEAMFDAEGNLTKEGRNVVIHEMGHIVDFTNRFYSDDPGSISERNAFQIGGVIDQEWQAMDHNGNEFRQKRYEYVESFGQEGDTDQRAAELFAVLGEYFFAPNSPMLDNAPETLALMEELYGPRPQATRTPAESTSTEDASTSDGGDTSIEGQSDEVTEAGLGETTGATPVVTHPMLDEHFERGQEAPLDSITDLENAEFNQEHASIIRELLPEVAETMNQRLQKKVRDGGMVKKIVDHIRDGRVMFKRFKAGVFVNPETGTYDARVLDMAAVVLTDFIATAAPKDPNKLEDTLEALGVTINEISDGSLNAALNGIPPSQLKDQLASDFMRLMNLREKETSGVGDLEGIAQGFAAEMITVMDQMGIVDVTTLDLNRDAVESEATTVLVNTDRLKTFQKRIRSGTRQGVPNTVREGIFQDKRETYSIGEKIKGVSSRQSRGNVALSELEQRALKKMQDTPHYVNEARLRLLEALGDGPLMRMLGWTDGVEEMGHPVLRRSALGKNASIDKNIREVIEMIGALAGDVSQAIYYPVGITKVGRHQYQGPNPQSNKLLRFLATPTWSNLNMESKEDMDAFWLGVAQASGLAKVEKVDQAALLETIKEDFAEDFGPAVVMMKELLEGGAFDADAFATAVGTVGPEVLGAIEAVASMEIAQENGQTEFSTSLSFELDGLTNGAANMMVNFGHGLFTPDEWQNLRRVGLYLGEKGMTVNQFFKDKTNLDLYETVGKVGDRMLALGGNRLKPWQKEQRAAAQRLAASIGNFEMVKNSDGTYDYKMTRNTAKNPMTKVNYGSGVLGVAVGVADDMLLAFYEKLQTLGEETTMDDVFYAGFEADMKTMGLELPANFDQNFVFPNDQVEAFRKSIMFTIGRVLTDSTREVLGNRIQELNDMLVLSTNIQNNYLQKLFDKKVDEMAERLAREGVIKRNKKGVPNKGEIPRAEWKKLEDELGQLGPIFRSDDQTLAIGGFEKKLTDLFLSSNYDEELRQPARMRRPDEVGVKAIPFSVIGTGDAMMMNLIFGSEGAPNDVLGIFDGLDVPVGKVKEYAPFVNQQVLKSWDRDVLSMPIANFQGFLNSVEDQALLKEAEAEVIGNFKKETVQTSSAADLLSQMERRLRENRARKKVMKQMAVSVDQMGGSDVGFTRDGETWDFHTVNQRIDREMEGRDPDAQEQVTAPVRVLSGKAVLENTRWTQAQKKVVEILKPLMGDTRVVFGTLDQLNQWRADHVAQDGVVLKAKGQYDAANDIVFMTKSSGETLLHEMVHAATYNKVLAHYQGQPNDAVARLEDLMAQFLELDGGQKIREAQAAINRRLVKNTPVANANALNEFMAYALSSSQVRQKLEGTQANMLANLKSKVIRLLRRMMGGVPEDMFSHVVFNTRVLGGPPSDGGGNGSGGDDGGDGGPSESSDPFGEFTNYWIQNIREYMEGLGQTGDPKLMKTSLDLSRAKKVMENLRQAGMLRNNKDKATFKAIYGIVLSDMKLDSNALIGLTKVFGHVEENLTAEMFGDGSEAGNTYSAVLNALRESKEPSHAVAVLFALSQTSQKFRDALEQIPAPEGGPVGDGSINDFLTKAAAFSMQKLTGSMDTNKVPADVLATVAGTIIDHDVEREFRVLKGATETLTAMDDYVSGKFTQTAEMMRAKNREVQASTRSDTRKYLVAAATFATNYLDKPGTDLTNQAIKKVTHMGIPFLSMVPVRELVAEMIGTDAQNKNVVALLDRVNASVSGMRQAFREDLPGILDRSFKESPTKEQWTSMFRTLAKTDFTSIVDLENMQGSMKYLEESGTRQAEMQRIETQLQQSLTGSNFQDAIEKGRQLAAFMNGKSVGKLLVRNAYAIGKNLEGDVDQATIDLLDRWITLEAVNQMDPQTREETVRLWQEDPVGILGIVAYLQQLNEAEEAKTISEQARLNGYKGYIPNEGAKNVHITVAMDEAEGDMERKGYKKLNVPYTGETDSIFPRSYYVSTVRRQGIYSQGVVQNVAMTYRGVDMNTGLTVKNDTAGFISGEDGSVQRIMENQLDDSVELENDQEALMPVFGPDGDIIGFERSISQEMIDTHLGREENLAVMLGAWQGRQIEEGLADQYNKQLSDELKRIWDNREAGDEATFIDLSKSDDPIYKDSWNIIPQSTKMYMESIFGEDGVMVPKSMVNLSVGYREFSMADMWSGKTRLPKPVQAAVKGTTERLLGTKAMRVLTGGEEILQGVVSTAKDIIVIRSLVVPAANLHANVIQLATRGVPTKTILKSFRNKLSEVEEYNKNRTKVIELEAKKMLLAKNDRQRQIIDDKIRVIEDLNQKMSIAPMLEAGAYKQLSEGITDMDVDISSGRLGDYMEALANRVHPKLGGLAEVGLVSKSTKMYQVANRATQYGDFLAKSIYYDHLISQGLSEDQALAQMNEEFVNFSALPGRTRSALEGYGLMWFMAFKLRITKIALQQLRDNPVRALAVNTFTDVGSPVGDNILSVIAGGRLDYATGFEMLFDAPELNPWVNLMSD
jgi:roadblock/LC7 domain-containing protein